MECLQKNVKIAFSKVTTAVKRLFSMSSKNRIFPRKWALGFINILPKGGDKTDPSYWRPITQTCVPAKLLGKIFQSRLIDNLHMHIYSILSNCQFGFRKWKSAQQAIFDLVKDSHHSMNNDYWNYWNVVSRYFQGFQQFRSSTFIRET